MDDLISRQAAIDELKANRMLYCDNTPKSFSKLSYADKSRVDEIDNAISVLVNLPSAQPEPEDCDTCKHGYFGDKQCTNCRVRFPSHYERRTDEQTD